MTERWPSWRISFFGLGVLVCATFGGRRSEAGHCFHLLLRGKKLIFARFFWTASVRSWSLDQPLVPGVLDLLNILKPAPFWPKICLLFSPTPPTPTINSYYSTHQLFTPTSCTPISNSLILDELVVGVAWVGEKRRGVGERVWLVGDWKWKRKRKQ